MSLFRRMRIRILSKSCKDNYERKQKEQELKDLELIERIAKGGDITPNDVK